MGWASYLEDNVEKANERALWHDRSTLKSSGPIKLIKVLAAAQRIMVAPIPKPVPSTAERWRQMRDTQVLCLMELRPKRWPQYVAHLGALST